MKLFLFLISVLLFNLPIKSSEPLNSVMPLIEQLRLDRTLDADQERERQTLIREQILHALPDAGSHETLEKAVAAFVENGLSNQYRIVNSKSTELHGNSDDEVFFLFDPEGALRYVVKAFLHFERPDSSFLPELSGNALIRNLELDSIEVPALLALGKYRSYGLLLESAVSGERLDQSIYALGAAEGDARHQKLEEAVHTFKAVGEAFAKLHQTDDSQQERFPKKWLLKVENDLKQLDTPALAEKLKEKIDIEALKSFVHPILEETAGVSFSPSYQFGSAHLKNIFYDRESGRVGLIDTGKLHSSVDLMGAPLADPAYDLIRIQEFLTRLSLNVLKKEEVQQLLEALFAGYQNVHPLPDERLLWFYTVHLALHKMITYSNYEEQSSREERENHFLIFQEYLNFLNEKLN